MKKILLALILFPAALSAQVARWNGVPYTYPYDLTVPNLIVAGTATVAGNAFSVGGSTLVVSGGVTTLKSSGFNDTPGASNFFKLHRSDAAYGFGFRIDNSRGALILDRNYDINNSREAVAFTPGNASTFNMLVSGNLGIGTNNPNTKLHISSSTFTMDGTGSPTAGYALCFQANKQMGKCTTAVAADGTCTCGAP